MGKSQHLSKKLAKGASLSYSVAGLNSEHAISTKAMHEAFVYPFTMSSEALSSVTFPPEHAPAFGPEPSR